MKTMNRMNEAQNYLDLNGLNSIRQQSNASDKGEKKAALETAAKQFEAIFMQMLLKSMRSAQDVLESDSPFNSQSTKFYRDMHDQQLALELSNNGSLGLSELIVRQLGGDSENFTPSSLFNPDTHLNTAVKSSNQSADLTLPVRRQFPDYVSQKDEVKVNTSSLSDTEFKQPKDFVTALTEPAKLVESKLNVPFQVVIAQAALETGWGQKIIKTANGQSSNNLFNIKADSRWSGDKTHKETLEFQQGAMVKKKEPFRVYQNLSDSVKDYIEFLSSSERYQGALSKSRNVEHFLHGLQSAGYATDPNYAKKIMATLQKVSSLVK
ncbi:flagellar assembly peptidoglycan hydrolase FlgJ [Thalassotalea sp. G2M2-11]|uniref:flagellar assembly peptidoglycan hydrolase FlgJ n=1 Tax=Thalassotalea sp. G2M2-11 TaxID=2787627 RepID=UPI001F497BF4|nr:flagellar assembly peptidoglycan hydrolase FlgJ [Thalassotalea sp. G2M2-11]